MDALIQIANDWAIFIVTVIGGAMLWELRRIHARIDKYVAEMDEHIKDGVTVRTDITAIKTAQEMHLNNGHRHRRNGEKE